MKPSRIDRDTLLNFFHRRRAAIQHAAARWPASEETNRHIRKTASGPAYQSHVQYEILPCERQPPTGSDKGME